MSKSNAARSRSFSIFNAFLGLLLLTSSIEAQDSREQKIDLGGYHLHAITSSAGAPTVVFESGMGEDLTTWKDIQPAIAKSTRTFMYDRAGLGQSDPSKRSRDAKQMARELHALLHKAEVPGPYLLVGHSLGGWIITLFAHLYPKEVAGLVLVDPAYQETRLRARMTAQQWVEREKAIAQYTDGMTKARQMEKDSSTLSGEQALQAFPMPKVPIVLLTGTRTNSDFPSSMLEKEVKMQVHQEWITRVPWTEHIMVYESRHYIQNEAPATVISSIHKVLEKARTQRVSRWR
jgi:pimeloyl-ACP methyl ester carboxylesterase